jgi:hypothetical protein
MICMQCILVRVCMCVCVWANYECGSLMERCIAKIHNTSTKKRREKLKLRKWKKNAFWGVGRYYQSFRFWQFGRERLSPPRRRGGRTRPLMMVLVTIESTSCGVTRPYQIPDPEGVYNYMSREVGKHFINQLNQRRSRYEYLGSTAMQYTWNHKTELPGTRKGGGVRQLGGYSRYSCRHIDVRQHAKL